MPIQTLGFLPHMNDFRRTLPDQIFRFLHGKSVVAVDDEDIGGRAFVARATPILSRFTPWSAARGSCLAVHASFSAGAENEFNMGSGCSSRFCSQAPG
jgi:hypothetical protein